MPAIDKIRIAIINIHGLLRGSGLEIGRDADNGGQTKYVYEVSEFLSRNPGVEHVDIFTRLIDDPRLDSGYSVPMEMVNNRLTIHRIAFGGKRYRMKEELWGYLDEFVTGTINHIRSHQIMPDWIHSHYADAGYAAVELSKLLQIPFSHTGHSLGRAKRAKLESLGLSAEEGERKFKFSKRIAAEENTLARAAFIVTSTSQEIESYKMYDTAEDAEFKVLAPGIDTAKFAPYYQSQVVEGNLEEEEIQRKYWVAEYIEKFLSHPQKPVILALSRPDRRKNLHTLLEVYGSSKPLQALANLVIFAGIRKDIENMPPADRDVLIEILLLMDRYDLYGKLAIPKKHDVENEVATIYRHCAEKRGVFVNLTLYENFGLTIIESASAGLPVVSTQNGGPSEIIPKCKNGILVDPEKPDEIQNAIIEILTNESKWKVFSNNGIINVKKFYSWEKHVDTYVGWIRDYLRLSNEHRVKPAGNRLRKMKRMLVTDIDGTLISEEHEHPGLSIINDFLRDRDPSLGFGIASGRSFELVKQALEEHQVPSPDFLVCAVGSEIYYHAESAYLEDKGWQKYLAKNWHRENIVSKLQSVKWLEMQEEAGQNPYKISYYYDPEHWDENLLNRMLMKELANVVLIPSHDRFLDILPKRASKGRALKYICKKWAIPYEMVVAAGDSGNDLDMLDSSTIRGIAVGNRSTELNHLRSKKNLYLAKENAAAGIMEGLQHFGWI